MDSILTTVKKILGINEDDTSFDLDIILHINSVLSILTQLGIGPEGGFSISDKYAVWSDFIEEDSRLEAIKTYVGLKVRMVFDPPLSSVVSECLNRTINELEWRLNVTAES